MSAADRRRRRHVRCLNCRSWTFADAHFEWSNGDRTSTYVCKPRKRRRWVRCSNCRVRVPHAHAHVRQDVAPVAEPYGYLITHEYICVHRPPRQTPLMQLGMRVYPQHGDWTEVPQALLEDAMIHVELRLIACTSNHRGRSTEKWLGRWMRQIVRELERRRGHPQQRIPCYGNGCPATRTCAACRDSHHLENRHAP